MYPRRARWQGLPTNRTLEIGEMLVRSAKPDLTLVQLHLRQALVALAVQDVVDAQHHVAHFQELATSMEAEQAAEILDLVHQGDLHQAEHEMQELLGEEEDPRSPLHFRSPVKTKSLSLLAP